MTAFMIDLDGTIYKGSALIPGAKGFIDALVAEGIPFVFLTNNSSFDRMHYLSKLRGLGLDVGMENILSSTIATVRYIKKNHPSAKVFPLGTEQFVREIADNGIAVDDDAGIVLLAFDKTITYDKINRAYHLLTGGAELIATHPDDLCPTEDGYDVDIGPFIRMFEQMTSRKATVIGKPNRLMAEMAASLMSVGLDELIMVGDRLYTDMRMASDLGIRSVLVLSGETTLDDLRDSDVEPTFIVPDIGGMVKELPELR